MRKLGVHLNVDTYLNELARDGFSLFSVDSSNTYPHSHKFLELAYVCKGSIVHTMNNEVKHLKKGHYFIVDYGSVHSYSGKDIEIINMLFLPEIIEGTLKNCSGFTDILNNYLIKYCCTGISVSPTQQIFDDDTGDILRLINKINDEYMEKNVGYMEMIRCHLIEIILTTMRKTAFSVPYQNLDKISSYIVDMINNHYTEQLTLSDICRDLNYSLPYVSKKFKEETGESFINYLQRVRLEESCRLLANTDKKIDEIAQLVGFSDTRYFRQLFKSAFKQTPNRFRTGIRANNMSTNILHIIRE